MKNSDKKFELIAKTFFGLEDILAEELKSLGASNIIKHNRAISFHGDKELMYKSNYSLRTALRILKPIVIFNVRSTKSLYRSVKEFKWEKIFQVKDTFAIDSVVSSNYFTHSKFVALKVKDAIADRFRSKFNERPSVDVDNPTIRIHVHIYEDQCTISLDSSGDSLHKRGYRTVKMMAPLNEALAAGMIMLSDWDRNSEFIDPMCGSGTIPIEAALIALSIAPGLNRDFASKYWPSIGDDIWKEEIKKAKSAINQEQELSIYASDIEERNLGSAITNAEEAGVIDDISFSVSDYADVDYSTDFGIIISNPPYGERLSNEFKVKEMYRKMGRTFGKLNTWSTY
ncbi:MAG: class I SAM-dependent RNA methyltransferase, partial [Melioribacteraceae bacterium]|nr:class I SAM-dependent RNA methyltransferase [Melioribacteraceae bacterium]